jgi:serine protease Do
MNSRLARTFLLITMVAIGSTHAQAAENPTMQELVARELPAVVNISVVRPLPRTAETAIATAPDSAASQTDGAAPSANSTAPRGTHFLGSGFIIDPSGIIVTNRHVIEGAKDILVTLQDNTLLRATLLAQADLIDVALLKVTPESSLHSVRFGDSDAVRVADRVVAIGNPLGLGGSVTQGIVSALNRDIRDTAFDDYIQTDAAINHGNSGGPLFNEHGDVIGMNTAIFSPEATSGSIGLGFAIPSNDVRLAVEALRSPGGMRTGTLGFRIQQVTPEIADALNMSKAEGVIVGGTTEDGAASKCGIMAGDIVLNYGNTPIKDVRALARAVAKTPPGTVVTLRIWRNDEPMLLAATVQETPSSSAPSAQALLPPASGRPGWQLARIDDAARHAVGLDNTATGVVVRQIDRNGLAAEAGFSPGDVVVQVQQEKVAEPDDITRVLDNARQQQRRYVAVLVQRNIEGLRWFAMSLD